MYPNISNFLGPPQSGGHDGGQPVILHANGSKFLGFQFGASVYKFRANQQGDAEALLLPSAGIVSTETVIPNGNKVHGGAKCVTGHDCSNDGNCVCGKCNCRHGVRGDKCQYGSTTIRQYFVFSDANGNGLVEAFEWSGPPMEMPPGCPTYFGETIASDLAILCISRGGPHVYRLPVVKFDAHGNPICKYSIKQSTKSNFREMSEIFVATDAQNWTIAITDPYFAAVEAAAAQNVTWLPSQPPFPWANEVISKWNTSNQSSPLYSVPALTGNGFTSDWSMPVGTPTLGYYVNARSGANFNADKGDQQKLTRYAPIPPGSPPGTQPKMMWRVGRESLRSDDPPAGQIVSSMRTAMPITGLVGIVDQSMAGVHIYTEDGLFVDSAFLPGEFEKTNLFGLPGEFFSGRFFHNKLDNQVYSQMGKASMVLFRLAGWANDTATPLIMLNESFALTPGLISKPSMDALQVRLRADQVDVKTAVFRRASQPPALDGGITGWESADTNISLWAGKITSNSHHNLIPRDLSDRLLGRTDGSHSVTAQLLHDDDHVYVRATMRQRQPLPPTKLYPDWQRMFTHGVGSTTLSIYLQGNVTYGKDCDHDGKKICNTHGQICNPGAWNLSEGCGHCYCHENNCNGNHFCSRNSTPNPGATRIVLGVFDTSDADACDGDCEAQLTAVALGMYPNWAGTSGQRYVFGTQTTGQHPFDNVQLLNATSAGLGVTTGFALDDAKTTLTLAVSLPRAAFPSLPSLARGNIATGFDLSRYTQALDITLVFPGLIENSDRCVLCNQYDVGPQQILVGRSSFLVLINHLR